MKYVTAFEIAGLVLDDRVRCGERYRPDVLRTAALAAAESSTHNDAIDAIENAFHGARISINPNWDGSIA